MTRTFSWGWWAPGCCPALFNFPRLEPTGVLASFLFSLNHSLTSIGYVRVEGTPLPISSHQCRYSGLVRSSCRGRLCSAIADVVCPFVDGGQARSQRGMFCGGAAPQEDTVISEKLKLQSTLQVIKSNPIILQWETEGSGRDRTCQTLNNYWQSRN